MQPKFFLFAWFLAPACLWGAEIPATQSLRLGLALYGFGAQSEHNQSRIAGTEIEAALTQPLAPNVEVRVAGSVQLETGASRARFQNDFQARQIQRLREAQVTWNPIAPLRLVGGAIDQARWESPLLLQRQSFPAILQSFDQKWGAFSLSIQAQQAVPADTSSLQPWGNWPQGMPGFYMERVALGYSPSEQWGVTLNVSHFLFENLAGPTAYQAQFLGNTVQGQDAGTTYVYGFSGFEWSAGAQGRVGNLHPKLHASLIQNAAAPRDKSVGWRFSGAVGWDASATLRLTPQFEWFRVDSDTAPAFYNDRAFGHANRAGFGAALAADWRSGIGASVRWVHSSVLASNPYQSGLDWVQVQLSTQYAVF